MPMPYFKYLRAPEITQRVFADSTTAIVVIADGFNGGAFEWGIEKDGAIVEHSDKGYGNTVAALRDGLNQILGE